MDSMILLEQALDAGLEVKAIDNRLVVRGPRSAEPVAKQILKHKPEIMVLLVSNPKLGYPITLVWPADIQGVGIIAGQWRRLETGEIEATYQSRRELTLAMAPALAGYDGSPGWARELAEALRRWPDEPPPVMPCRPFGTGRHTRFWRHPKGGWVCSTCHPPHPNMEVETWEIPM